MMTMKTLNTIKNALNIGMDFDTALAVVTTYTANFDVTTPDDDNYGTIVIGNLYGNSLTLTFNDNDLLADIDLDNGDWD